MKKKQGSIGRLISTIIAALCGGILFTLLVLQHDPAVKEFLGRHIIRMFERSIACNMEGSLTHINFFSPTITLSRVSTRPKEAEFWKWDCEKFTLQFSWAHVIWYGIIDLHVTVDHIHADSQMHNGKPDITKHLEKIISGIPKGLPLALKSITFKTTSLTVNDDEAKNRLSLSWSGESKVIGDSFKSHIHFIDGTAQISGRPLFNQLGGTLECYVPKDGTEDPFVVRANCSLGMPLLNTRNKNCFITGYFIKDHGMFTLQSVDGSLLCGPFRLTQSAGNLVGEMHAKIPISCLANIALNTQEENDLSGTCALQTKAYLNRPYRLFGSVSLYDVAYKNNLLVPTAKLTFGKQHQQWKGSALIQCEQEGIIEGTVDFDEATYKGNITFNNKKKLHSTFIEPWYIEPHKCMASFQIDPESGLSGTYNLNLTQPKLHTNLTVTGSTSLAKNSFCAQGLINNNPYEVCIGVNPHFVISASYREPDGNELINIRSQQEQNKKKKSQKARDNQLQLEGLVTFPFVRSLVNKYTDIDLQGEGTLKLWSVIHPNHIAVKAHLDNGTIRLPHTYNFINGLDAFATFNLKNKQLAVHKINCHLHKGTVRCNGAVVHLDTANKPIFVQVPLLLDSCLINNKDDLFAVVSGNLVFTKDPTKKSLISGTLLLDRTQLKENIFSHLLKKDSSPFNRSFWSFYDDDIDYAVSVATQSPIRINTPFLETTAKINLMVKQNIKHPAITGSIELLSGTINFPYKPLYITKAQLHFLPHQLYDPIIEVTAKNKIKKYTITMSINGSLQNYSIRLESTPPLNEEQIIALLLAGSEEESLSIVAPALIMQNIKTFIFSSSSTLTGLDSYVRNVFNPFKHIHLVPSFIDQSGRGGLRAAIEIDINERWRAFIQKNFSLSEDTRLEVDYFLSDDICFKAVRDEHRDVSGEVEMRWKF